MKREIKFRGKDEFGDWQYGSLVINVDTFKIFNSMNDYEEVDGKTVEQYTGMNDIDGNEMYEGDIISFTVFDDFGGNKDYKGVIKFNAGMFQIWHSNESEDFGNDGAFVLGEIYAQGGDITVLGNIYDNPEQLKESEEQK
jgi:uncharacterized phage protein (TIGR01671 family)